MHLVLFCHSLYSDWNHGNAHFLRGISTEWLSRGHTLKILEPADAWSYQNLLAEQGHGAIGRFCRYYPSLRSTRYKLDELDLNAALEGADIVLVHEWSDHELVRRIGEHRARHGGYLLFFHDTHHRAATSPQEMARYELTHYDGVLAFGEAIRQIYLNRGWAQNVWTWHEAADTRVFHPMQSDKEGDLVWIGNWGDDERTAELQEFLLDPVRGLGLRAKIHGVRYPESALQSLAAAGIEYGGWLPNYQAPEVFARYRVTVHVPRRPYATALPGIPTIRIFEALACGIPLVSAPWEDSEHLFTPGKDFLVARTGEEMKSQLIKLLQDRQYARQIAEQGRQTILARHTCAHRVDQLEQIAGGMRPALLAAKGAH